MIVFLDIDGVIIPYPLPKDKNVPGSVTEIIMGMTVERAVNWHCPESVAALKRDFPDARFVLISSWRYLYPKPLIEGFLRKIGLFGAFDPNWFAPMTERRTKSADAQAWMDAHGQGDWIAIDDHNLSLPIGRQIVTVPSVGYRGGERRI